MVVFIVRLFLILSVAGALAIVIDSVYPDPKERVRFILVCSILFFIVQFIVL